MVLDSLLVMAGISVFIVAVLFCAFLWTCISTETPLVEGWKILFEKSYIEKCIEEERKKYENL